MHNLKLGCEDYTDYSRTAQPQNYLLEAAQAIVTRKEGPDAPHALCSGFYDLLAATH